MNMVMNMYMNMHVNMNMDIDMDVDVDTDMDTGHEQRSCTWILDMDINMETGHRHGRGHMEKTTGNVRLVSRGKSISTKYCKYCLSKAGRGDVETTVNKSRQEFFTVV